MVIHFPGLVPATSINIIRGLKKKFKSETLYGRYHKLFFKKSLCHHILSVLSHSVMSDSPPGSTVHGDSSGKNTGVGCHALLWGSSQPRDGTQVS